MHAVDQIRKFSGGVSDGNLGISHSGFKKTRKSDFLKVKACSHMLKEERTPVNNLITDARIGAFSTV
jgi:hypothetical protein